MLFPFTEVLCHCVMGWVGSGRRCRALGVTAAIALSPGPRLQSELRGSKALLFSNNEEQETSAEAKVKPRRGLGCEREAEGLGGPHGTLCGPSPLPPAQPVLFTPQQRSKDGVFQHRGGSLCGPFCPQCRRCCCGGRKAIALSPTGVSLPVPPGSSCSGCLAEGGGREGWLLDFAAEP